jgi:hypothetical protein
MQVLQALQLLVPVMQVLQALQLRVQVLLQLHLLLLQVLRQQALPCCWTVHGLLRTEWPGMKNRRS